MNLIVLGLEFVLVLVFLLVKVSPAGKILVPLVCFLLATYLVALSSKAGLVAQLATGFAGVGISFVLADLLKNKFGFSKTLLGGYPGGKTVVLAMWTLLIILAVHNLLSLDVLLDNRLNDRVVSANPWGITSVLSIILYTLVIKPSFETRSFERSMFTVTSIASLVLGLLAIAIVIEIIPGNTSKLAQNMGGRGLANWSTNETGILACSLLLWNMRFLLKRKSYTVISFCCVISNLAVVVLTKGRIALAASAMVIVFSLLASGAKTWTKAAVLGPLTIVFFVFAYRVFVERTTAELTGARVSEMGFENLPGSGRPLIWFYYLDAFMYSARSHPLIWVTGVGVGGLLPLYDFTPLEQIGEVIEHVSFYPLHSDFFNVFITSGILGLFCWVYMLLWFWRAPKRKEFRLWSLAALAMFALFMAIDMVNYIPVATVLLFYAIVSSIGTVEETPQAGRVPA